MSGGRAEVEGQSGTEGSAGARCPGRTHLPDHEQIRATVRERQGMGVSGDVVHVGRRPVRLVQLCFGAVHANNLPEVGGEGRRQLARAAAHIHCEPTALLAHPRKE